MTECKEVEFSKLERRKKSSVGDEQKQEVAKRRANWAVSSLLEGRAANKLFLYTENIMF